MLNHQLCNWMHRLHFHISLPIAILFHILRPPRDRANIRHLGFGRIAITADDREVRSGWKEMHNYIATESRIETVTIWVPQHMRAGDAEWFFWPAIESLVRILLDGGIESVRLLFAMTYSDPNGKDFTETVLEPITLPNDEVLIELFAVYRVLYSKPGTEEKNAMWRYAYENAALGSDLETYTEEFDRSERKKTRLPLKVGRGVWFSWGRRAEPLGASSPLASVDNAFTACGKEGFCIRTTANILGEFKEHMDIHPPMTLALAAKLRSSWLGETCHRGRLLPILDLSVSTFPCNWGRHIGMWSTERRIKLWFRQLHHSLHLLASSNSRFP